MLRVAVLLALLFAPPISASAEEKVLHSNWPRFRGPEGTGHSPEVDLPWQWSPEDVTWRVELPGTGQSSPIVWGDKLFLTAALEDGYRRAVIAIDRNHGNLLWQREYSTGDPGKTHSMNRHASATCATDGKLVFSSFGKGGFYCHDFDGKLVWMRDDLGEFLSIWGTAASPVLFEDLVIIACDQDTVLEKDQPKDVPSKAFIIAMDKLTGKTVWKKERMASRGWGTPVLTQTSDGAWELLLNGPGGVIAYNPTDGTVNWNCDRETLFGTPSVVFTDELIFAIAGRPGPMLAIRRGGKGNVTSSNIVWSDDRRGRDLASPILANDLLLTVNMQGIGICYDPLTGKQWWKQRLQGEFTASPVYADGKVYFLDRKGTTVVLAPEKKFNVLARNPVGAQDGEDFLASPAISDGQIFLRSDRMLYAVGKRR